MPTDKQLFLFALPGIKTVNSARKVHICRLYDILELSLHRGDLPRARRTWSILARCKEVNWRALWKTGALLVGGSSDGLRNDRERLDYLTSMMLQHPDAVRLFCLSTSENSTDRPKRETIIQEMILHLIHSRKYKAALDEVEL